MPSRVLYVLLVFVLVNSLGAALLRAAAVADPLAQAVYENGRRVAGGEENPRVGCGKGRAMARLFRTAQAKPKRNAGRLEAMAETDVLHYDLDIEVSDIDPSTYSCYISGSNNITIQSKVPGLTEFTFRLQDHYAINGSSIGGTNVTVDTESLTTRVVTLDRPYGLDEVFILTIEYEGLGDWLTVTEEFGVPVVSTLSECWWAFTWWPAKDSDMGEPGDNSDKATMEFSITVPDNFDVPSNGVLQSVDSLSGGRARYNWASNYPIATYLVSFAVSEYNRWTEEYKYPGGTMPVEFYIYDGFDIPSSRAGWNRVVDMLKTFAGLYGEYPFIEEKYGIYNFPFGGGMEHQTMTGQGSWWAFSEDLSAHELAHQWWGDSITCKTWNDIWLNEGFATYGEFLWEEFKYGASDPDAYYATAQYNKPWNAGADDSVYIYGETVFENRIFSYTYSYQKGAWVLHMLRHVVGDETFFDILADYRAAFDYSAATTDEFIAVAENTYGADLHWFFDEWVYNAGAPEYEYGWNTSNTGGQDYLHVRIEQVQSYPDVTIMPVDLVVHIDGGEETITVWNDAREQWFHLPVSGPVEDLSFDPFEWILRNSADDVGYQANPPAQAPSPYDFRKNRYIAFSPNNEDPVVIKVEAAQLVCDQGGDACSYNTDCPDFATGERCRTQNGFDPVSAEADPEWEAIGWLGEPCRIAPGTQIPADTWHAMVVSDMPTSPGFEYTDPDTGDPLSNLFVSDCEIMPRLSYGLKAGWDGSVLSERFVVGTAREPVKNDKKWADVVGQRDAGTGEYTEPNQRINVDDVQVMIVFLNSKSYRPHVTVVDLSHEVVNYKITADDLSMVLRAFNITEDYPPLKFQVEASGAVHPRDCPSDATTAMHDKCE